MAESLINSIARLRVIEKKLLTKEFIGRLLSSPGYEEALKLLSEAGYGAGAAEGGDEIEQLTRAQLEETYALTDELMPKRFAPAAEVFRMKHDMLNVKLLYKLRMQGEDIEGAKLDFGGVTEEKALKAAIASGDYSILPKRIALVLEELDVLTYRNPDPRLVSDKLDAAYIEYARSIRSSFTSEYFGALADFTNMLGLVRGFEGGFLPGGEYGPERLEAIRAALANEPEKAPELIKSPLETSLLKEKLREAFTAYLKDRHAAVLESARDEYLLSLASSGRSDIDSPAPIIGFLLAREREAEVVRLILTAKRSGIPASALEERSFKLYG